MAQIITNDCGQQYQTANALKTTGAIVGAYALKTGVKKAGKGIIKKSQKTLKKFKQMPI